MPAGKEVAQPDDAAKSFIRVSGNVFVDDSCREFLYTGWNGCVPTMAFLLEVSESSRFEECLCNQCSPLPRNNRIIRGHCTNTLSKRLLYFGRLCILSWAPTIAIAIETTELQSNQSVHLGHALLSSCQPIQSCRWNHVDCTSL